MFKLLRSSWDWLTVAYRPRPDERPFLKRLATQCQDDLEVRVAVLGHHESRRFFAARLARKGIQPVWVQIVNQSQGPVRLDLQSIDPAYYTPLEAAYVCHFALGKRLLSFGLLAWMFLPLLPLVPFKYFGARAANKRMNAFFKSHGFPPGMISPGETREGFVFTHLDEGTKTFDLKLVGQDHVVEFSFSLEVVGLALGDVTDDGAETKTPEEIDEQTLRCWIERQPRATTNLHGTREGDPLNLVVVGDRATILLCFGARWDEAETITMGTCWKTFKAFALDAEYRYSPVSALFLAGCRQELALQRARASINERLHLRLWRTPYGLGGQPVWIGQVSRDIGVRFTPKTWNLTTHRIDPDVDEARDYVIDDLMAAGRAARVGYAGGVGAAPVTAPRKNLTGDPYFTDGQRSVIVLSRTRTAATFFRWT